MLTSDKGDPSSGGKGSSRPASSLLKMASPLKRFMNLRVLISTSSQRFFRYRGKGSTVVIVTRNYMYLSRLWIAHQVLLFSSISSSLSESGLDLILCRPRFRAALAQDAIDIDAAGYIP